MLECGRLHSWISNSIETATRQGLASQNVHDASFVHADSLAGTMPILCGEVRLRPSGYGATAFVWLEPKLTLRLLLE